MAKPDLSINLLDNKGKKIVDHFLEWAIAIGRLLIIITETVALGAFLYRFSIDRQLVDLNDEIKKSEAIVAYFKSGEDTYRHIQTKLSVSKTQLIATANTVVLFQSIVQLGRDHQVTLTSLSLFGNNAQMAIQATTIESLSGFLDALKQQPRIANVSIDKVENRTSKAVIIVTISASLKPAKTKP